MKFLNPYFCIFLLLLTSHVLAADVLIDNLNDVYATGVPGTVRNLQIREKLCIGVSPEGNYNLTAHGDGAGGSFTLANAAAILNYRVFFRDRAEGFHELYASVPLTGIPGRKLRANLDCRGNAAQLRLEIDHQQINSAVAGVYRGTLVLTVSPE